jgi:two-component system NarL family response regulator
MLSDIIHIFVIDDDIFECKGLSNFFTPQDGIVSAGHAPNCDAAYLLLLSQHVDVILLDLYIRGTNSVENLKFLTFHFPNIPVIIFSYESASVWMRKMFMNGAKSYLIKGVKSDTIKETIVRVAKGDTVIPPGLFLIPDEKGKVESFCLTDSQADIIRDLALGKSIKEIALKRKCSQSAVEKSLKTMRQMYKASTNYQLIFILKTIGEI